MSKKKGRGLEKVQVDESTTTRVSAIRHGRVFRVAFTVFLLFFCMPLPAPVDAEDVYWEGDADYQWSVQENWDSDLVPVAWDRVFIVNGSGVAFNYDYTTTDRLGYLEVDNDSNLWLDYDAQTLSVGLGPGSDGGGLTVGNTGSGILDQFGGNVYLNATYEALILGNEEGSTGRYNLNYGTLTVVGYQELIGNRGTGQFYQEGGLHEFGGAMYIGNGEWGSTSNSAYGLYVMNDGELRAIDGNGGIVLGEWGSRGDFLHYYGTVEIGELTLGRQVGGVGYYVQSGGSLTVNGWERIGNTGTGEFMQNGGNHTVEDLTIGNADWYDPEPSVEGYYAGTGTYYMEDLSSGASLRVLHDLVLGDGGNGVFIHTDGSVKVENDLKLGREFESFTGRGEYEIHNGTLEVAGSTIIGGQEGYGGTGLGAFSQDGGTNRTGWLFIGDTEGAEGSYTLEGGELVVSNNDMVGMRGTGTFTQSGGIHRSTGGFLEPNYQGETIGLVVGNSMTSEGTYNLDSGELDVSNITVVGYEGAGTFNLGHEDPDTRDLIGDGTHGTAALYVGFKPHSYGEYHLYAGCLSVSGWPGIVVGGKDYNEGGGEGVFNQYGGTVNTTNLWLADSPSSLGTYNLFDGELTSGTYNVIGVRGSGMFNQYGGTYTVAGDLNIAGSEGSSGTYNFLGGLSLQTGSS
jgi:hypothetical protein